MVEEKNHVSLIENEAKLIRRQKALKDLKMLQEDLDKIKIRNQSQDIRF